MHWAASSDDVDAIDALVAAGADIEAPGATAFGQWDATRRLIENGAQSTMQVLGGKTERQCVGDYDSTTISNICAILGR